MRLLALLLNYTRRILRSMKTAQPGINRSKEQLNVHRIFFVQIVHVLDVYLAVCMQRSTT